MKKTVINFLLIVFLLAFFATDVLTLFWPKAGAVGFFAWMIILAFLLVFSLKNILLFFLDCWKNQSFYTLTIIIIFVILLTFNFFSNKTISGETTQETACVLNHIAHSVDRGFHQTCLFGYPAKQYYLTAIPSLLFGREKWTLSLGGSLYFLLALPIFIRALFSLDNQDLALKTLALKSKKNNLNFWIFRLLYC